MPSPFQDQWLGNQVHRGIHSDSEPEIVILTDRKGLVESTNLVKQLPCHHHRGGTHQTEIEAGAKDISGRFAVFFSRIHPPSPSYPELFCLADPDRRTLLHEGHLNLKLFRLPEIIGIEKGQVSAAGTARPQVARRRHAAPGLGKQAQVRRVSHQALSRSVLRPVVHHDELEVFKALAQNGLDRFAEHRPAIVSGDDNADQGFHFYLSYTVMRQGIKGLTASFLRIKARRLASLRRAQ